MGLLQRIMRLVSIRTTKALNRVEDPRDTFDDAYERQLRLLADVRRGVADVATAGKRLELRSDEIRAELPKLDSVARQALDRGQEDMARLALTRQAELQAELDQAQDQARDLRARQRHLEQSEHGLAAKVSQFRTAKEQMKAQYTAAEAEVRIGEAITGASAEMADLGIALRRAQDRTQDLQARAAALHELGERGYGPSDSAEQLTEQLNRLRREDDVDQRLQQLRESSLHIGHKPATPGETARPDTAPS
ncbi:PspA/IM30 family protein [Pedococcus sp. NPDC057267]|uniref:PspA/IM30 family protein n=1 Tax=Pedococcus sp. NPDC057267 TaxID=3346077 RepID=UPI00363E3573